MAVAWLTIVLGVLSVQPSTQQVTTPAPGYGGPEVTTTYGRLQGLTTVIDSSTAVDVFLGIPYAKPPVGPLRLKKPEPPSPWPGVKVVTSDTRYCVDTEPVQGETEDCLYLDVYRPRQTNSSLSTNNSFSSDNSSDNSSLSVIVWIHGGGWTHGSKNKFNGTLLAARGVIVVMINYRLGPLGFFSTEDDVIPGNFGVLDQISALQWVQSSIGAFGGDPTSVTIVGESAGSQAASLLLYSPLAKGLFARAVMQSAVATGLKFVPPPSYHVHYKDIAQIAGEMLGCPPQPPSSDLLQCLQNKTFRNFVNASLEAAQNFTGGRANTFKPRIETTFGVLLDNPVRLLARGEFLHVDTMRGFNSQENGKNVWDKQNDGLTRNEFLTNARRMMQDFPYVDADKYVQDLEDLYIANVTDPLEIRAKTIDMKTDFTRVLSIVRETKLMQQKNHNSSHFLYQFDYLPSYQKTPDWQGVIHALNVPFEFGFAWVGRRHKHASSTDIAVADMMMEMWVNFAKFGDPTPRDKLHPPLVRWKQFYPSKPWYLVIKEQLEVQSFNSEKQTRMLAFWEGLVQEYMKDVEAGPAVIG